MKKEKKLFYAGLVTLSVTFAACTSGGAFYTGQENTLTITSASSQNTYTEENGVITFYPKEATNDEGDSYEYIISGTYTGQFVTTVAGTELTFSNATLISPEGEPAIIAEKKTTISFKKDTKNYISSTSTTAAIYSDKKNIKIGGKGSGNIKCWGKHGIKADDVEFKGSGIYNIAGGEDGSAVNCNTFTVEAGRNFTAYLKDSKNGIKADETVSIASGTFYISNNTKYGIVTDSQEEDSTISHSITLSGGKFVFSQNN